MITPHIKTKIDVKIKEYNRDLYNKIITLEAYVYNDLNNTSLKLDEYPTLWKAYSDAWVAYIGDVVLSELQSYSIVTNLFSVVTLHITQSVGTEEFLEKCNSKVIFNSGGLISEILAYPDDYYNDIIVPLPVIGLEGPALDPEPAYSPRMDIDIPKIPIASAGDSSKLNTLLESEIPKLIMGYQVGVLFSDPIIPDVVLSKQETWDIIFKDMGWQDVITQSGHANTIPARPA